MLCAEAQNYCIPVRLKTILCTLEIPSVAWASFSVKATVPASVVLRAVAAGFIAYQFALARDRSREHCFAAFRNNQWVGLVVFLGIALSLLK